MKNMMKYGREYCNKQFIHIKGVYWKMICKNRRKKQKKIVILLIVVQMMIIISLMTNFKTIKII